MRLVTTVHGWVKHTRRTPLYYGIDRLCLPRYEKVLCVSADLHEAMPGSRRAPDRCLLIENGIDTAEYARRRRRADAKRELGISARRLVRSVPPAAFLAEKGFDLLIRAVDRLLQSELDVELMIIGEGDDRSRLEELIGRLGRADRCRLIGFQAELRPYYEAMDVFALSSLREGIAQRATGSIGDGSAGRRHGGERRAAVDPGRRERPAGAAGRYRRPGGCSGRVTARRRSGRPVPPSGSTVPWRPITASRFGPSRFGQFTINCWIDKTVHGPFAPRGERVKGPLSDRQTAKQSIRWR